jgi:hypothetical protein
MVFPAASLAATLGLLGGLALPAQRFTYSLEWTAAAVALWLVSWCLDRRAAGQGAESSWVEHLRSAPSWGRLGRWASRLSAVAGLLFVAGLALATLRNVAAARPAPPVILPAEAAAWKERMWRGLGAYDALRDDVALMRVRLAPGYQIRLRAGERLDHWSPVFDPRPYDFTVVAVRPSLGALAVYAGAPPAEVASDPGDVVLMGLPVPYPDGEQTLEVIATGIGDPTRSTARVAYTDPSIQAAHADDLVRRAMAARKGTAAATLPR